MVAKVRSSTPSQPRYRSPTFSGVENLQSLRLIRIFTMSRFVKAVACSITIVCIPGCSDVSSVNPSQATENTIQQKQEVLSPTSISQNSPEETGTPSVQPTITPNLTEATWEDLRAFVAQQTGKIVVLDIWSTSCEPCLAEFPFLVALQAKNTEGITCVSFNCDYIGVKNKPVEYYRPQVMKSLEDLKASSIINFISTVPSDDLFQQMDLDTVPAVFVFNRSGRLVKRFDNRTPVGDGSEGISYERQVIPLVEQLLKDSE